MASSNSIATRSEAWFRALMEQSPFSKQVFSPDGRTIEVNRAWEALWGITIADVADYNVLEDEQLVKKGIMPYIRRGFAGEALQIPAIWYDVHETLPDRSKHLDPRRWIRAFIHPIRDADGTITEIVLVHEDMTEQKRIEDALRSVEASAQLALQVARLGTWEWNIGTQEVYADARCREICGLPPDESLVLADIVAWIHPEDLPRVDAALQRALSSESDGIYAEEFRLLHADGSVRWVVARGQSVHRPDEMPGRMIGTVLDITEQKIVEQALRQSQQRFSRFMQHLPGLAWIKDSEGRYLYANDAALAAFDTELTDLLGKSDAEIFPPQTAAQFRANDEQALIAGAAVQVIETLKHKDGQVHHSIVNKFPIPAIGDKPALVGGMAIDITDLQRTQAALAQSEARLRLALDAGRMGVWEWDLATNRVWWSDNLEAIHGLQPGGFAGTIEAFQSLIHPEDAAGVNARIAAAIESQSDFEIEFRNVWPDGSVHWMSGKGRVYCENNQAVRLMGVGLDVTARRQAEEALKDADRRKNEFLATLAHELRNPLAPIGNGLQLLRIAGDNPLLQDQARSIMERQLQQMVRLIDDLLDVSRITRNRLELRKERVQLASIVQNAVEASRPLIESQGHELTIALPAQAVELDADATRLAQIICNLLNNAAKYTNRGGSIALLAELEADAVVISVRDNGIGIAAEHLPRLFEMFSQVTTALERSQGGLGIGLALIKGLVELHGGTVWVKSAGIGRGSEFNVRLPLSPPAPPQALLAAAKSAAPSSTGRRILVVDDNKDGADTLAMMLRKLGHATHAVHDGLAALEAAEWFRPEVILLDIGLPKLNGYEVAERIRASALGQQVLLIAVTGWGQEEDKRRAKAAGFDFHLTKPVEHAVLMRLLTERL